MNDKSSVHPPRQADLVVVFGPCTTLAKHVLSTSWAGQKKLLLVARDKKEAKQLSSSFPDAEILACWLPECEWNLPEAHGCIMILLCAFSVIHPVTPDWSSHCEATRRDTEILAHVLQKFRGQVIKLVFISSVLAISPAILRLCSGQARGHISPGHWPGYPRRRAGVNQLLQRSYYASFKCLAEAMITDLLAKQERASLSVLYPGRLVNQKSLLIPLSFLHTTYRRLAQRLVRIANSCTPHKEIVGLDARILLALKAVGLLIRAVFG